MAISSQGYTFNLGSQVETEAFPVTVLTKGNVIGGIFIMVFAVLWSAAAVFIGQGFLDGALPYNVLPFVFIIPGIGLAVFGLYSALLRIETTLDGHLVTIKKRTWFTTRTVTLPLSDYPGVLRKRVTYTRNKRTHTAWVAALPHDEKTKRVVLGASSDEAEGRKLVENYARWLNISTLESTVDGFEARAPEDVDRSLAELAAQGKVASSYRAGKAAPAEVHVETGSDMIIVSFMKTGIPLWLTTILVGLIAAVIGAFVGFGIADDSVYMAAAMAGVIVAVVFFGVIRGMKTRRQLILRRDRVVIAALGKDGKEPKISAELMLNEIEGLRIDRAQYGGNALWFDTDRGSFPAGDNSPRAALDYVRDLVIAALATAGGGAAGKSEAES
ncbi:MAG: hypothetical protein ACKVH7_03575 [Alphaproteobacteria bacterium]|jgi:hypothetical protein